MHDPSTARILQIARGGHLNGLFPQAAARFDLSAFDGQSSPDMDGLLSLHRAIGGGDFDLIVCEPNQRAPWHPDALVRVLFSRKALQRRPAITRPFGLELLRRPVRTPIAVIDYGDNASLDACDFYLLKRSRFYFKRELPVDAWRLFANTVAPRLPSRRFRSRAGLQQQMQKFQPISLGLAPEFEPHRPGLVVPKTADIFFAGSTAGLSERERGLAELLALRERGVKVDIPEGRLDRPRFFERCAAAHLVWSPEGFGWDCLRHYEAAACGSVPVINYPSIRRYAPQDDGVHALFYAPEPGGLTRAVLDALRDKPRLAEMGRHASLHARQFHDRTAIGRYVVETCLGVGKEQADRDRARTEILPGQQD